MRHGTRSTTAAPHDSTFARPDLQGHGPVALPPLVLVFPLPQFANRLFRSPQQGGWIICQGYPFLICSPAVRRVRSATERVYG
jgi:hypothetical protein